MIAWICHCKRHWQIIMVLHCQWNTVEPLAHVGRKYWSGWIYTAFQDQGLTSICPLPSPAHHKSSLHFQQFRWMVWKYQSELDRKDCNMHLSGKALRTHRTLKSRRRPRVLIANESHNTMFFHIHPATSYYTIMWGVPSIYLCIRLSPSSEPRIFCFFMQHDAIFDGDPWKMSARLVKTMNI